MVNLNPNVENFLHICGLNPYQEGNLNDVLSFSSFQVTRLSRKNVCFIMFIDEVTLQTLTSEGLELDRMGFIGLWKIVVVKNLPYSDMRRVGKIPKLLSHRLFPSAR